MWRKLMRITDLLLLAFLLLAVLTVQAQDPEVAFHSGAKAYIGGNVPLAKRIVHDGLKYNPADPKLNELLKKLEEKEKQNEEQQKKDQQDQENKEKGDKSEESGEDEQKQDQKPENGEPEPQDKPEENPDENENQDQMAGEPQQLDDQKISKEKAMMILEAMRNNEIQYIQQQRKKVPQRPSDGKPDW